MLRTNDSDPGDILDTAVLDLRHPDLPRTTTRDQVSAGGQQEHRQNQGAPSGETRDLALSVDGARNPDAAPRERGADALPHDLRAGIAHAQVDVLIGLDPDPRLAG